MEESIMSIGQDEVCHIAILVRDLDKAVENWAAVLSMEKPEPWYFPASDKVPNFTNGEPTDCSDVRLAVFQLPNVRIELVQPGQKQNAFKEAIDKYGEGLQHISFIVPDRHQANQCLQKLGMPQPYHIGYWPEGTYAFVNSRRQLGIEINVKTDDNNAQRQKEVLADRNAHKKDLV
jgi:catechol 2,3-dioxygenase-like lactoylglutathione lyase family enzyme